MFPIFLDLKSQKCLVVGAGKVAKRKIKALLQDNADITVVSKEADTEIIDLAHLGIIKYQARAYEIGEAANYFMIVAATDDPEINRMVSEDAQKANKLVNVVDIPDLCNFYASSIVKRGDLQIAISTSGKIPALAKKIRKELESYFSNNYEELIEILAELRNTLKTNVKNEVKRKEILECILDSEECRQFLQGKREPLLKVIDDAITANRH